jgi:hypothetical protein
VHEGQFVSMVTLVGHGQNPVHVPARKEWGDKGTMIDDA